MASEPVEGGIDNPRNAESEPPEDEPRVLLFMEPGRDRDLLLDTLGARYAVDTATDPEALETTFDCCVVGQPQFARNADTIRSKKTDSDRVAVPFVLLVKQFDQSANPNVWEYVDDVIELPVSRDALSARIENLVEKRVTALELSRRQTQLEETVRDLERKERALDEAPVGLTITDWSDEDNAITYVNRQFEELTGYDGSESIGRNCRFLQGEETDPADREAFREAVAEERSETVEILNYRKNGQKFWNRVKIAPVHDEYGSVTNFVGFQQDVTKRKIRERRLEVLNRVLSHNLRNKMNIIEGHSELLRAEYDSDDPPESLTKIADTAGDLEELADAVRKVERTMSTSGRGEAAFALDERIAESLSAFQDRFPAATFEFTREDEGPYEVAVTGLLTAIDEAVENAVEHNDSANPSVTIRLKRPSDDWIDIEIEDDGPGVPEREIEVLREGETDVNHADRLGFWLIYWVVSKAGGNFAVSDVEPRGSLLTLSVPAHE